MQDPIGIQACFSSTEKLIDDSTAITRSGQSVFISVYRTRVADHCRLITVTWCKNLLLHGLSISIESPDGENQYNCKVELKPWYFWRKYGSKRFIVDDKSVDIFWDLKAARFHGETEPTSEYYVAVVCNEEVVLLLGDLKKEAYKKTNCRPAMIDPILISRKEHIFGKKKFITKEKFHGKDRLHEISIECKKRGTNSIGNINNDTCLNGVEPEMEIRIDGHLVIHVKHLQWKFRGNETIHFNKLRLEVYWDVHDWLFSPGLRQALFIFKPVLTPTSLPSLSSSSSSPLTSSSTSTPLSSQLIASSGSFEGSNPIGSSEFCLFLYVWRAE